MSRFSARAGRRAGGPLVLGLAILAGGHVGAADAKQPKPVRIAPLEVKAHGRSAACKASRKTIAVGGRCHWTTSLRFKVPGDVASADLLLKASRALPATVKVRRGAVAASAARRVLDSVARGKRTFTLDVLDALPAGGGEVTLVLESASSRTTRFSKPVLQIRRRAGSASGHPSGSGGSGSGSGRPSGTATGSQPPKPGGAAKKPAPPAASAPAPAAAASAVPAAPVAPVVVAPVTANPSAPTSSPRVWVGADDLRNRPASGPAWTAMKAAADGSLGTPDIADQNSDNDVDTLAAALVYARIGGAGYRAKVAAAIAGAIGTEAGGRTLALGRNLASYVIAADLIGLGSYDSALDARFRTWLAAVRTENLQGLTLISTHEKRPNNWGTMAGASRIAADLYLGDGADLARAATVFRGYLGDRGAYTGFDFGDLSYQSDPSKPVGINPAGATKSGIDVDGAIPDDMRRGCSFQPVPCHTGYPWEALQGVVTQAELLSHHGLPAFGWSGNAVLRAALYLQRIDQRFGGWWASSDDGWQPWLINHAYGTSLPAAQGGYSGKVLGWTTWVYGG
jgi:hypothetical protein